jgi:exopolysaccharide biosynthesis polyprenyl glycosylphosphotransferase
VVRHRSLEAGASRVAINERLDAPVAVRRPIRSRVPLSTLLPAADAFTLCAVIALLGTSTVSLAYGVIAFAVLNGDTSRKYRLNRRLGDEAGWLLGRVSIALLLLLVVHAAASLAGADVLDTSSRELASIGLIGAIGIYAGRGASYALERAAKRRGMVSEPTLIVGDGTLASELARELAKHPDYGLRPIGILGRPIDDPLLPRLGEVVDLPWVVTESSVRRVLVAFGDVRDQELVTILRANEGLPAEIHVVPRFFELSGVPQGAAVDDVCGVPLFHLRRPALRSAGRVQKRAFDLVVASLLFAMTAPLFALLALAVRLSSPGPVLFRQQRVGRDGRLFEMLKFRTMFENDGADTEWFESADAARLRVTGIGHLLRRSSLDELPQLINVMRGEMSLVGPRPERPHYTGRFAETVSRYDDRHRVVGGLTGWAQIHGRDRDLDSVPERARLDNYYIENWSIWRDIVILVRTLGVLLRGR